MNDRTICEQDPWLVAVCAGHWQVHGIRSAMQAGIRVLALDGSPDAPGLRVADRAIVVDIRDSEQCVAAVRRAGISPAGAVAFTAEVGMAAAGVMRDTFGLPGAGMETVGRLTDKVAQRRIWDSAGLPNPRWRAAGDAREAAAAAQAVGFPLIVKPADSSGSRGVSRVDKEGELEAAVAHALAKSHRREIVIEAVLPGAEFTVETFASGGRTFVLAVTEKRKVPGTRGTVSDQLATPDMPAAQIDRIAKTACAALQAVGYTDGPGHVEIMFCPKAGPSLVEAAGRGAGFMVFEGLVPAVSGYDIATATALQAVGRRPAQVSAPEDRRPGLLRFFPNQPGVVRRIEGFDAANQIDGVEAAPFIEIEQRVGAARADSDRLGYILTTAETIAEAHCLADRAESLIRFHIEP